MLVRPPFVEKRQYADDRGPTREIADIRPGKRMGERAVKHAKGSNPTPSARPRFAAPDLLD
jgi:hypothetical protein